MYDNLSYAEGRIFGNNLAHGFLNQSHVPYIPEQENNPEADSLGFYAADFIFFINTTFRYCI